MIGTGVQDGEGSMDGDADVDGLGDADGGVATLGRGDRLGAADGDGLTTAATPEGSPPATARYTPSSSASVTMNAPTRSRPWRIG
jgi:hypothetical protein